MSKFSEETRRKMSEAAKRRSSLMTPEEKSEWSKRARAGINTANLSAAIKKVHERRINDGSDRGIRNKIRATRIAKGDWTQRNDSEWAKYKRLVRKVTSLQPIHLLENFDKRGRGSGKYHLDHIVSQKYGFDLGIPFWMIGDISNLRFIPESENCAKQHKVDEDNVLRLWFSNTKVFR